MLEFKCKSCGKRVQGDEALAGQSVVCPACNTAMTFPQSANAPLTTAKAAADDRFREMPPPGRDKVPHLLARWSNLLVVGVLALILIGLAIPVIQKMRVADQRTQSINNLKRIGLAFHSFHDANRRLPYNGTANPYKFRGMKVGGPAIGGDASTGSWAFMILPHLDQQAHFNTKDPNQGVAVFMCPGRGRPVVCTCDAPGAWTDYFLNSFINDPNGDPNASDRRRKLTDITDGSSWTIMLGHGQIMPADYSATDTIPGYTDIIFNGGSPGMCRPNRAASNKRDAEDSPAGDWGGPFPQGCLTCMADGCIRTFPYSFTGGIITNGVSAPPDHNLGSHLTPSGGEIIILVQE
jgi:Protein of unknown function (DUF1559)